MSGLLKVVEYVCLPPEYFMLLTVYRDALSESQFYSLFHKVMQLLLHRPLRLIKQDLKQVKENKTLATHEEMKGMQKHFKEPVRSTFIKHFRPGGARTSLPKGRACIFNFKPKASPLACHTTPK